MNAIPEPATLSLAAFGLFGAAGMGKEEETPAPRKTTVLDTSVACGMVNPPGISPKARRLLLERRFLTVLHRVLACAGSRPGYLGIRPQAKRTLGILNKA